ncbi:MAG: hypothetical protein Q7R86_01290 [bacterium]|nr:hypothetical protein [bacterium]
MKQSIFLVVLAGGFLFLIASVSSGQTPEAQVLITWEASTYTPPGFEGKALPIEGSLVTASMEVFDSSGRLFDLREQTVYWYLNDKLIKGGVGIQTVIFRSSQGTQELRVQLPDYLGGILVKTIEIPVVRPEAVVSYSGVGGFIGNSARAEALPYFFNVGDKKDLEFSWKVNDQAPDNLASPEFLDINLPAGAPSNFPVNISLSVVNKNFTGEAASKLLRLILKK